jgi:flagellar hook-basal body complex protein FliE
MQLAPITEVALPRAAGPLGGLRESDGVGTGASPPDAGGAPSVSFGEVFGKVIEDANHADAFASQKVDALARGVGDDLHGTMIAVKEADISVKLVATIRNKLLDAFNEIWKTSV